MGTTSAASRPTATPGETKDQAGATLADHALDAVYTGVGLVVLAVNRVQVARRDHARAQGRAKPNNDLGARLDRMQELATDPETVRAVTRRLYRELQAVDDLVVELERRIDSILDRIEPDLPDGGRELVNLARSTGKDLSTQTRAALGLRG